MPSFLTFVPDLSLPSQEVRNTSYQRFFLIVLFLQFWSLVGTDKKWRVAQNGDHWVDFSPLFRSQKSNSSIGGNGRVQGSPTEHFRHLEGPKKAEIILIFQIWRRFRWRGFVQKMGLFYKFWTFARRRKPGGMRKIRQKGGFLRWDMSHFSSGNFDFRALSEWKRLQFHGEKASTRRSHGVAYEWLSRNAKSGYFVLNFDTQSVKLGFKNWLKNAPIFPISGGPVTFRPSLKLWLRLKKSWCTGPITLRTDWKRGWRSCTNSWYARGGK